MDDELLPGEIEATNRRRRIDVEPEVLEERLGPRQLQRASRSGRNAAARRSGTCSSATRQLGSDVDLLGTEGNACRFRLRDTGVSAAVHREGDRRRRRSQRGAGRRRSGSASTCRPRSGRGVRRSRRGDGRLTSSTATHPGERLGRAPATDRAAVGTGPARWLPGVSACRDQPAVMGRSACFPVRSCRLRRCSASRDACRRSPPSRPG